jgi:cbb3-type cytochrome oxidase cytochrome c subunit
MDPRPGTLIECKKLFTYFSSPIVKKVLDNPTDLNAARVKYMKSVIADGVEKYMDFDSGLNIGSVEQRVKAMDALIAYLQVLGTMVDFSTFTPDASR